MRWKSHVLYVPPARGSPILAVVRTTSSIIPPLSKLSTGFEVHLCAVELAALPLVNRDLVCQGNGMAERYICAVLRAAVLCIVPKMTYDVDGNAGSCVEIAGPRSTTLRPNIAIYVLAGSEARSCTPWLQTRTASTNALLLGHRCMQHACLKQKCTGAANSVESDGFKGFVQTRLLYTSNVLDVAFSTPLQKKIM